MPRVIHFDVPADDPQRAIQFYATVFGWNFDKWSGGSIDYWLVTTGKDSEPGINGGLSKRMPGQGGVVSNSIDVPDVDEYSRKIQAAGGKILNPKMAIPGVGWFAACTDSEGNLFGIMQADPAAE
jgi:uncharacterized protein